MPAFVMVRYSIGGAARLLQKRKTRPRICGRVFPAENGLSTTAKCLEVTSGRRPLDYFSDVLMDKNLVLRLEPSPLTTVMMARLIPAAGTLNVPDLSGPTIETLQPNSLKLEQSA
jgi:hypothetical protein